MNLSFQHLNQPEFFVPFLSRHEIDQLAQFIENAFEHFRQYQSSCERNFLNDIQIIVDCYSLVNINARDQVIQDERLRFFHCYSNFKKYPNFIKKLSFAIAEMIVRIADKIRLISHSWFYAHFAEAIRNLLSDKRTYLYHKLPLAQSLQLKILNYHAYSNRGLEAWL